MPEFKLNVHEAFDLHRRYRDGEETYEDREEILKLLEDTVERLEDSRRFPSHPHTVTFVTHEIETPDPGDNWDSIIGLMIDDKQVMLPKEAMVVVRPMVTGLGYRITAEFMAGKLRTLLEEDL